MDETKREMTKIAREVSKFTARTLKEEGIGTAEFDFIHAVRHNPGITQAKVRELLGLDKGACARRAAALEHKGYLTRRDNPQDAISQLLYATKKADHLKTSKSSVESMYYEWLLKDMSVKDRRLFVQLLEPLYQKSKKESIAGFPHLKAMVEKENLK